MAEKDGLVSKDSPKYIKDSREKSFFLSPRISLHEIFADRCKNFIQGCPAGGAYLQLRLLIPAGVSPDTNIRVFLRIV
jgi:hypothetical protein